MMSLRTHRLAASIAAIASCTACASGVASRATPSVADTFASTTAALPPTTAPITFTTIVASPPVEATPPPAALPTTPPLTSSSTPATATTQPLTTVTLTETTTSPEQQAIVDAVVRTSPVLWVGWIDPNDPSLDVQLESVFVGQALDDWRAVFAQMRRSGLFVRPDPNQHWTLMPIPSSISIDGATATIRTCTVSSGLTYRRLPDGAEQLVNSEVNLYWRQLTLQEIAGTWLVSGWSDEPGTRPGDTCREHP